MNFDPRPYQWLMIQHALTHPRCAWFAPMGFGKTSAALFAVERLNLIDPAPVLVLAPLRVAKNTWPLEAQKWGNLNHIGVCPIVGNPQQREWAIKQHADVFTMTYENLPWLVKKLGNKWPYRTIIADESTRLKSFRLRQGGLRARALSSVAWAKVHRFIELTGTPSPNGLQDLWGQLWFLDKGKRLGRTYTAFKNRWFREFGDGPAKRLELMPFSEDEILDRIKDICMSLRIQDWFDVDEPIVVDVPAYLPESAMALYKKMEKDFFFEINQVEVEAKTAAAKSMKLLQIANGAVYKDKRCDSWETMHDAKIEALESVIEECGGEPIIVAYNFQSDLHRLKKRFPQAVEIGTRSHTISCWNAGKIPILLVHPASAGHGLNLQDGGRRIVMFGHNWDLEQYQQVVERIGPVRQKQAGHPRQVYIYNIRAVNTIDALVIERRKSKARIQDLLLEATRR